jgi:tetratricopeptide (TPR) repeat protein
MTRNLKHLLVGGAVLCAAAGDAETLPVSGVYPAGNDAAAALNVIAVERFGGSDGQLLAIALADKLRAVTIAGKPYFRVVPSRSSEEVEAVLQGTAQAEATRRESGTREEQICVERDEERKCIRREKREIPCWDHIVRLDATVRLIRVDGEPLHSFDRQEQQSQRYCEGDDRPSTEGMVRQLANGYADSLRYDLAPVQRANNVRVAESRDGLTGDDNRAFRDAVRKVEDDISGACNAWTALEARHPQNVPVLFNIGLCLESYGRLDEAYGYYERALAVNDDADYPTDGVRRIERRRRAEAQLASHRGR